MRCEIYVEDVHYVQTDLNPADLSTRGTAKVSDLSPSSFWQLGPSFLRSGRDSWPVTRDFVECGIPGEEVRGKQVFLSYLRITVMSSSART